MMLNGRNARRIDEGMGIWRAARTTSRDSGMTVRTNAWEHGEVMSWTWWQLRVSAVRISQALIYRPTKYSSGHTAKEGELITLSSCMNDTATAVLVIPNHASAVSDLYLVNKISST
jgi:hypothetical protein